MIKEHSGTPDSLKELVTAIHMKGYLDHPGLRWSIDHPIPENEFYIEEALLTPYPPLFAFFHTSNSTPLREECTSLVVFCPYTPVGGKWEKIKRIPPHDERVVGVTVPLDDGKPLLLFVDHQGLVRAGHIDFAEPGIEEVVQHVESIVVVS